MSEALKKQLAQAVAIIFVAGGCVAWLGDKIIDYTFEDVRSNTNFRVSKTEEIKNMKEDINYLQKAIPEMNEKLSSIDKNTAVMAQKIQQWENAAK